MPPALAAPLESERRTEGRTGGPQSYTTYILLANPGTTDLVIIEVQAGSYLGEDDIVRFDDVYGRK